MKYPESSESTLKSIFAGRLGEVCGCQEVLVWWSSFQGVVEWVVEVGFRKSESAKISLVWWLKTQESVRWEV